MEESTIGYIEGGPQRVREGMLAASERYQTGDLAVVTNCYYFEHRVRSYELVAQAFRPENPTLTVEAPVSRPDY